MDPRGWARIKTAAEYADVSTRSIRRWMKAGLRYSRLPSGTILISKEHLDAFIGQYATRGSTVDAVVDELCRGL